MLSFQADFYLRVFVRVHTSAAAVKATPTKLAYTYVCQGCGAIHTQRVAKSMTKGNHTKYSPATGPPVAPRCDECESRFSIAGPIWAEPYLDPSFLSSVISHLEDKGAESYASYERLRGMLSAMQAANPRRNPHTPNSRTRDWISQP